MVTVLMYAYNHEKYVSQALDGVLMQETDFKFEIIIHDDASTDKTAEIIREYERKYSDIIRAIYQTENKYSKGEKIGVKYLYPLKRGKYQITCECDDYWITKNKLQLQVDFLEKNPEYSAVSHKFMFVDEESKEYKTKNSVCVEYSGDYVYTIKDLEKGYMPGQTTTLLRRDHMEGLSNEELDMFMSSTVTGDRKLVVALLKMGNIYCLDSVMSAYRLVLNGESWSARHKGKLYQTMFVMIQNTQELVEKLIGYKMNCREHMERLVINAFMKFLRMPTAENRKQFTYIFKRSKRKLLIIYKIMMQIIKVVFYKLVAKKNKDGISYGK